MKQDYESIKPIVDFMDSIGGAEGLQELVHLKQIMEDEEARKAQQKEDEEILKQIRKEEAERKSKVE